MNLISGHVFVVINGILTHDLVISSKGFSSNTQVVFEQNLVLGTVEYEFNEINLQSEASVTNVNIFSAPMNISQMIT